MLRGARPCDRGQEGWRGCMVEAAGADRAQRGRELAGHGTCDTSAHNCGTCRHERFTFDLTAVTPKCARLEARGKVCGGRGVPRAYGFTPR
eukprot:3317838-Prymnesium_polylepis.1